MGVKGSQTTKNSNKRKPAKDELSFFEISNRREKLEQSLLKDKIQRIENDFIRRTSPPKRQNEGYSEDIVNYDKKVEDEFEEPDH